MNDTLVLGHSPYYCLTLVYHSASSQSTIGKMFVARCQSPAAQRIELCVEEDVLDKSQWLILFCDEAHSQSEAASQGNRG